MAKAKRRVTRRSVLVKCKGCGTGFVPKDRRQKFHSAQCRTAYYLEHYGSPPVNKTCPNCGKIFSTTMPKKQTYCSPECREESRLKKQDELNARAVAEKMTYLGERYATLQKYNFSCAYCGKSRDQGAVLDIVDDNEDLKSICLECKIGREFLGKKEDSSEENNRSV